MRTKYVVFIQYANPSETTFTVAKHVVIIFRKNRMSFQIRFNQYLVVSFYCIPILRKRNVLVIGFRNKVQRQIL